MPGEPELRERLARAVEEFGPWQPPHNIHLGHGVWTITDRQPVENSKLRMVVQLTADLAPRPLERLRVLDLACEGGVYGIELARRGAEVVAIEGRAEHVGRARFAAGELGLGRYEVRQDDVRNVNRDTYGEFDVVLCLGILYHLDAPDVFEFVHAIAGMTRSFALVDTQVSLAAKRAERFGGHEYWGRDYVEHDPDSTPEERERRLRASLDNPRSFWLTVPSLINLLGDAGFTSVLQAQAPRGAERHEDRIALIGNMGSHEDVPHNPEIDDPRFRWPEHERLLRDEAQTAIGPVRRAVRALRR